ncbi:reverse transcriptase domain-containing protein [Tanacetum coccineum]
MVKPKNGNDVEFEINSNFMRELRRKLFKGTDDKDAYEHVRRVLEIAYLFHFPGFTHDVVMLRVFPVTLKGPALRWINRLSAGLVTTWDLFEESFIRQYCPPLKTTKKLEEIHNFKQEARTTMSKENVKEPVPHDLPVVQTYVPPMKFLGSPFKTHKTVCMMGILKEIHKMKAQEDEGNTDDGWDITVKNVDRFRQILTPTIHTLPNLEPMVQSYVTRGLAHDKEKVAREKEQDYDIPLQDHVMQPLTPQTVHITPPGDNYVAPATNPILNKHLNEFGEEFANNTRVFKKIDSNPVNDLKELLKTYDFETFIRELLH